LVAFGAGLAVGVYDDLYFLSCFEDVFAQFLGDGVFDDLPGGNKSALDRSDSIDKLVLFVAVGLLFLEEDGP